MARTDSLSILLDPSGKEKLAEIYGRVIKNLQARLVSGAMKNRDLSGDPTSGSVEAKRFANAKSQNYGTARAANKGNGVKAKPVVVTIDTDKEIVEEIESKDTKLYGVFGLLELRAANHVRSMAAELDTAFFKCAADAAAKVEPDDGANIRGTLEKLIQALATVKNDYVDGVEREYMHLVLSPSYYGQIRNELDSLPTTDLDSADEEIQVWHKVRVHECVRLPDKVEALVMVEGAVAQPVIADTYNAEKIPLSDAIAVELFYYYGTKEVTPDLIFKIESGE